MSVGQVLAWTVPPSVALAVSVWVRYKSAGVIVDKIINPPYVAGQDGARPGTLRACVACGAMAKTVGATVPLKGMDGWVCADFTACVVRYRQGVSPESFAAGLRGEILGITP